MHVFIMCLVCCPFAVADDGSVVRGELGFGKAIPHNKHSQHSLVQEKTFRSNTAWHHVE